MLGHWLLSLVPFWLFYNALSRYFSPSYTTHCYARVETNTLIGKEDSYGPGEILLRLSDYKRDTCINVAEGKIKRIFHGDKEKGKGYAYPGFWDGHGHLLGYGEMLQSVKLYGAESINEVRARIKEYVAAHPGVGTRGKWIRGIGWDQAHFGGAMPTAQELEQDPELKGLYIMLDRVDVHCAWVSESVLALLPNPLPYIPGGEITLEPGPGVFCDNAMDLPLEHWPRPTKLDKLEFMKAAMKSLHSAGIVGTHDAGVVPEDLEMYDWMADTGLLSLRVYGMIECPVRNTFCANGTRQIERDDGMLSVRSVKLFADGALGSWGAALLEPYSDKPDVTGTMLIEQKDLIGVVKLWYSADYQVNVHAIGDRATRAALTAFQHALATTCPPLDYVSSPSHLSLTHSACLASTQKLRRLRLEHSQILHPSDQELMASLGIIASVQPTHATSDSAYALDRLGSTRLRHRAYRMQSFLDARVRLVLGSDFPVEPPSILDGMYAAVTRQNPGAPFAEDGAWYGEEALEVRNAVDGFTRGPAWGSFMDGKGAGELKERGWADWVVLDKDLVKVKGKDLREVAVLETWVAGRRVFCRDCGEEDRRWGGWWRGVRAWKGWWGLGLKVEKILAKMEEALGLYGL